MFEAYILRIVPENTDERMLHITEWYLGLLISISLFFFVWIILRVTIRWFRIFSLRVSVKNTFKKQGASSARQSIQSTLSKRIRWARDGIQTFHAAWHEACPSAEEKAILPIRLREFLTPEIVLDGARNRRLAEALPGILVALGIFGTFLGLVLGLQDLELGKIENLRDGIGNLISGLSLAFLTSLAGISLSIVFSILYRLSITRLERSFLSLDLLLSDIYPYDSQERYARRHYELQADVKQGLQTLATDVATQLSDKIGSNLSQALEENLVPVIKDLNEWISNQISENKKQQTDMLQGFDDRLTQLSNVINHHFENSQDRQSELITAALEHFATSVTHTFTDQFENMGRIIEQTMESQQEIKKQLIDFSGTLEKQLHSQSEMIDKTNRAGEILGQSLGSLETIAQNLKSSSDDIGSAAELLEKSANSAKEGQELLQDTMLQQISTMTQTREELESAWQMVTDNSRRLTDEIGEMINELTKGIGENLVKALSSFDGKMAEIVERFSGTLFEAGETISDMPGLMASINESLGTISQGISDQKDVLKEIRETSENLVSDNIERACEAAQDLGKCTENISNTSIQINQFLETFNQGMQRATVEFEQRNQDAMTGFKRLVENLTKELKNLYGLLDSEGPIYQSVKSLEKAVSSQPSGDTKPAIEAEVAVWPQLTQRLDKITDILSKQGGNGDRRDNPEVIQTINSMNGYLSGISKNLDQTVFPKMAHLSEQLNTLSIAMEQLNEEIEKKHEVDDSRRWSFPFARGSRR